MIRISSKRAVTAVSDAAHASTSRIAAAAPAAASYSTTPIVHGSDKGKSPAIPHTTRSVGSSTASTSTASSTLRTSAAAAAAAAVPPLPWLNKPLGVPVKPTKEGVTQTRKERADYYLAKGRAEERKRIVSNAAKGYFADFHDFRRNGGKSWRAPTTMIRSNRALWFPRVEGTCLKDRQSKNTAEMLDGKVSVVCLLNTGISTEHTKSFYEPTVQAFSHHEDFQLVQLNLQPNLMKHYLLSLFLSSLRSQVPEPQHGTYLLSKLDLDSPTSNINSVHREDLNVHNIYVGYTYLVDQDGLIRWAGSGFAEPQERKTLVSLTGSLLGDSPRPHD